MPKNKPQSLYEARLVTMGACQLVSTLVDAAFETGYYSGKGEDGGTHHLCAITRRQQLRDEVLRRLVAIDEGEHDAQE